MQFTHAPAEFRFPPSIFKTNFVSFLCQLYSFVSASFPFHFMLPLYCFFVSISFHAPTILLLHFHFRLAFCYIASFQFSFCFSALFVPCNGNIMLTFLAPTVHLIGAVCCTHTVCVRTKLYMSVPFNGQPISVLLNLNYIRSTSASFHHML